MNANPLFRIIGFRSTNQIPVIICSRYPYENRTSQFENPVSGDAVVVRLIYTPYEVFINEDGNGKSMRKVFSEA